MIKLLLLLLFIAAPCFSQTTSFVTDRALAPESIIGAPLPVAAPMPYASVRVCSLPLTQQVPCLPLASVSDMFLSPLSNNIGSNFGQLTTDVTGRYTFGCATGTNYQVQVQASASNSPAVNYPVSCPGFSNGGSLGLSNTVYVSQQTGATADVKFAAACALLPSGGTLDARGFGATTQTIAATVSCGGVSQPITILFDPATVYQPSTASVNMFVFSQNNVWNGLHIDTTNQASYSGNPISNAAQGIANLRIDNTLVNMASGSTGPCMSLNSTSTSIYLIFAEFNYFTCFAGTGATGITFTNSNSGFINGNTWVGLRVYNAKYGISMNQGATGAGIQNNKFFSYEYEASSLATALAAVYLNASTSNGVSNNQFYLTAWDITAANVGVIVNSTTGVQQNYFYGQIFRVTDNSTFQSNIYWDNTGPVINGVTPSGPSINDLTVRDQLKVTGTLPVSGTATFTGPLTTKNFNSIRFADQFAGADCGAKINSADADLGATAGEIWVNQNCGMAWTTPVTLTANHILRFVQSGTYTSSALIALSGNNSGIVGNARGDNNNGGTALQEANNSNLPTFISVTGYGVRIEYMGIDGNKANNTTATDNGIVDSGTKFQLFNSGVYNFKQHNLVLAAASEDTRLTQSTLVGAGANGLEIQSGATDLFWLGGQSVNNGLYNIHSTGTVGGLHFTEGDFSNTTGASDCIFLDGTSGTVNAVQFVGININPCQNNGIRMINVNGYTISGVYIENVGQATNNTYDGIQVNNFGFGSIGSTFIVDGSTACSGHSCMRYGINLVAATQTSNIGAQISGAQTAAINDTSGVANAIVTSGQGATSKLQGYNGHSLFGSAAPSITACGTSPSVTGNDNAFTVTTGSTGVTSCTVNFATAFTSTPTCTASDNLTSVTLDISAVSTTSITFSSSASITTQKIYAHCF